MAMHTCTDVHRPEHRTSCSIAVVQRNYQTGPLCEWKERFTGNQTAKAILGDVGGGTEKYKMMEKQADFL